MKKINKDLKKGLPVNEISSINLVPRQERIIGYIDGLNAILKIYGVKPSMFLEGATFLCNPRIKHNPDWVAQAAHSFREIGYLFSGAPTRRGGSNFLIRILPALKMLHRLQTIKLRSKKVEEIIRIYLEEAEAAFLAKRLTEMTHVFADISHHYSRSGGSAQNTLKSLRKLGLAKDTDTSMNDVLFLGLAKEFLNTITETISAHLTIHRKIDLFCESLKEGKGDKRYLAFLLSSTPDARKYFFAVAPSISVDWLKENGFLDVIKEKSNDVSLTRYCMPELDYLARVAESDSKKVVDFMLSFDSTANLNLETIDRFLWICTKLPAKELVRIIPIIRDKQWVQILADRNHWSFGYKQMFETLASANKYLSIRILAEAVLAVRSKEDERKNAFGTTENPFYLSDLHYCEVFNYLKEIRGADEENVLKLVLSSLSHIIRLSGEKEDDIFQFGDIFSLFDVDFFTLSLESTRHLSSPNDVRDLAAIAKIFIAKIFSKSSDNSAEIRRLYNTHVVSLPNSRTMWRFRLYIWSLCPEIFHNELKDAFFSGLDSEKTLWPITGGTEYKQALQKTFGTFSVFEREKYIKRALELFEQTDKEHPYGFGILSSVYEFLSEDDKKRAEELYGRPLESDFHAEASTGRVHSGFIDPQPPPDSDSEWKKPIPDVVQLLKTKWSPEEIVKADTNRDFLRPINAEGVASELISRIKERSSEYIASAPLFFDRDSLDAHYTYTFLRGLLDLIQHNHATVVQIDWTPLIILAKKIIKSGTEKSFETRREREKFDAWLSGWDSVLSSLADVIKELLRDADGKPAIDVMVHRDDLLEISRFLLLYPDPQPADEKIETAKMTTLGVGGEHQVSDPLTIAINSTRGRAFEMFVFFVEHDSKKFPKDAKSKLSEDVRAVYEKVLRNENTYSITFVFGQYIAFFYYRDADWIEKVIMPILFSKATEKKDLFLAAWEGYLSSALYDELFQKFHDQYARAILLNAEEYTKRKYRTDLDEGLAIHLSLAYIHFKEFNFDSDLYKSFWNTRNLKRWGEFISFVGRTVVSRDNPKKWLKEHPEVEIKKLEAFWDWALDNCDEPEALNEFGFWMQAKDKIFDPIWLADRIDRTLEKTNGNIKWEIGLMDSLPDLVKAAPEKTLSILRRHLIDGTILKEARGYIRVDKDLIDVLKILYTNPSTKDETYKLVNELLPIGGGQFWELRSVIV